MPELCKTTKMLFESRIKSETFLLLAVILDALPIELCQNDSLAGIFSNTTETNNVKETEASDWSN